MRRRYVFAGKVQGVGFRATTHAAAAGFAVTGWVRNEPDRTVMMEAQGEPAELDRFVADLSARMARNISSTQMAVIPDIPTEGAFVIRR